MYLEIVTPEKTLYAGEVDLVQVPGSKGSFEILRNHAPIISSLATGKLRVIDKKGDEAFFDVTGGVVECINNNVVVLAEDRRE